MKKFFNIWLMAALVCGLGMSVTSCKDDNNDNGTSEEAQQAQASKALKFYEVVSHLADLSEMDDATYASQTFEPIIGEESQNDPLTRIVATNDMETAAARFADIIGKSEGSGFPASTPSYTYSDPDVGTLTYTKSTDGSSWATVDVDIKQVPHLTRIVYCTPEQMGDNGKFEGTAYYRFGDVIKRRYVSKNLTEVAEYWICVRPAFGPEGKGDSHWISVGMLPEDNMFHHSGSNGTEYYVPTKVCTDKENMQNFAEMLYAMFNPEDWWETLITPGTTKPKIFNDFTVDSLHLHNKYFWKNVYDGWKEKGIAELAFNMNSLEDLKTAVNTEGLNLLYSGYSWLTTFSWNCELYNICYTNGTGAEANFHKVKTETIKKNMKDLKFDCHKMGNSLSNYNGFFGDNKHRWVVRYAKGKQLMASGTFNKFEGIVGCTDVWNYNRKYGPTSNLSNTPPKATPATNNDPAKWKLSDYKGRSHYTFGDIYKDENGHKWYVAFVSGDYQTLGAGNPANQEYSPYTELISFEGFNFTADGARATNLPTRAQVIHSIPYLQDFFSFAAKPANKKPFDQWKDEGALTSYGYAVENMLDYMDFEIRDYFQRVNHHSGRQREDYYMASVAYKDDTTNKQRLLRFVGYDEDHTQPYRFYLWDHYVANPDSTTILYTANQYSQEPIYLQDVTDLTKVRKYAPDLIACLPLSRGDGMVEQEEANPRRQPRTTTDDRNARASNCVYNRALWRSRSFVCDMWNSPVLMYRLTRVYDRGDSDYATITDDGHTLTLYHARKISTNLDKEDIEEAMYMWWSGVFDIWEDYFVDGVSIQHPTWRTAWGN